VTDRYQWVHGYVLDTMIATALDRNDRQSATPLIADLGALAARCDMRELLRPEIGRGPEQARRRRQPGVLLISAVWSISGRARRS
jgi:hypothetical protein